MKLGMHIHLGRCYLYVKYDPHRNDVIRGQRSKNSFLGFLAKNSVCYRPRTIKLCEYVQASTLNNCSRFGWNRPIRSLVIKDRSHGKGQNIGHSYLESRIVLRGCILWVTGFADMAINLVLFISMSRSLGIDYLTFE